DVCDPLSRYPPARAAFQFALPSSPAHIPEPLRSTLFPYTTLFRSFWTRGNAEVCLLATRGHPKRQAANVHQFIIAPIQEHSRKPDEARDKIVALMGDVPRVELFARQSPPGWDVWGNEVESTVPDFWTKCPEVGAKGG